jgi:nicotinamidase-related amidase
MGASTTLHGNAPDHCPVALLLIDVINDMEFDRGSLLLKNALPAARKIAKLKGEARRRGVPVIYVNDNFGRWRSDFKSLVSHCLEDEVRGEPVARLLMPDEQDYFVLKPKHSGFFSTSLGILLDYLGARRLVLTGFATEICVIYTANDAYMRDYELAVPRDCVASETAQGRNYALAQMQRYLRADVRPANAARLFKGTRGSSGKRAG